MGDRNEGVGERGQILLDLRRIVDLCHSNPGKFGPLSRFRSRFIHNPTGYELQPPFQIRFSNLYDLPPYESFRITN